MSLRVGSVVINCVDLEEMTRFWVAALDLRPGPVSPEGDFRVLGGDRVHLSLQVAGAPITSRGGTHLDLYTEDQAAEVDRLCALGARVVRRHHDPDDDYVVLADPEGNPFCVCAVGADS
ncbi:MAG TPA: VOC family protein [Microlunatus sp.]|nr:VOC family protein [Microlunatus sp.]